MYEQAITPSKHLWSDGLFASSRDTSSQDIYFDWEAPRSREGYYRLKGGVDYCVQRATAYAPYCDMLWMETAKPELREAAEFAHGVHAAVPGKMLAYNLSPSFNWVGGDKPTGVLPTHTSRTSTSISPLAIVGLSSIPALSRRPSSPRSIMP